MEPSNLCIISAEFLKKIFFILLTFILFIACDESPTGRGQLTLIPDGRMTALGEDAFERMKKSAPVETDPRINAYVQCVADNLIQRLPGEQPDWEVKVFQNATPNAFALPGGKIGVHTGMLQVAETPDQLAAVIGHEIGHVMAEHSNERLTQQLGVKVVLFLVNLFSDEPGSMEHELLMRTLGIGSRVGVLLPFSRVHEREADILGLELMSRAGFDPAESVRLWRNMAERSRERPLEFLSTHPSRESRIQKLSEEVDYYDKLYRKARADGRTPHCG